MTRRRVSGWIRPLPLIASETVVSETPAALATSRIVGVRPAVIVLLLKRCAESFRQR
jgi:hypothetical protein